MLRKMCLSLAAVAGLGLVAGCETNGRDGDFAGGGGDGGQQRQQQLDQQRPLFERIGGEVVLRRVVDQYFEMAFADEKLNFTGKGTPKQWEPNPGSTSRLKERYYQFLASATAGPQGGHKYEGQPVAQVHKDLGITPEQFEQSLALWHRALNNAGVSQKESEEFVKTLEGARQSVVGHDPKFTADDSAQVPKKDPEP
jgi:hemoglobin